MKNLIAGIELSNSQKIVYDSNKITKYQVAKYYEDVSELMKPYLNKRLLSVIRCHDGVGDACFFKKHPTTDAQNIQIFIDGKEEYFYVKNKKQIVYQAQMGTIEFHIWGSKVPNIDSPDLVVFDLDPDTNLSILKLRKGVLLLKEVLEQLNLKSFLKTSGGKGYHVVVPIKCKSWNDGNQFAKRVAELLQNRYPKLFTTNIRKAERGGKIFVDYLRNSRGATCVCPYSLRARENATISLPIEWDDINKIKPNQITIKNYKKYISINPWQYFFKIRQSLK